MSRAPDPRIGQAKEFCFADEKLINIANRLGLPEVKVCLGIRKH